MKWVTSVLFSIAFSQMISTYKWIWGIKRSLGVNAFHENSLFPTYNEPSQRRSFDQKSIAMKHLPHEKKTHETPMFLLVRSTPPTTKKKHFFLQFPNRRTRVDFFHRLGFLPYLSCRGAASRLCTLMVRWKVSRWIFFRRFVGWKEHVFSARKTNITRWWQLKYFFGIFTPNIGEDEPILTSHIFQRGWFNHQLVARRLLENPAVKEVLPIETWWFSR